MRTKRRDCDRSKSTIVSRWRPCVIKQATEDRMMVTKLSDFGLNQTSKELAESGQPYGVG